MNKAIAQYRKLDVQTVVDSASPHQLIEMLIQGACARMKQAKGCIQHGDIEGRSRAINATLDILSGLQASLDHERGGDLSANLDALYDYMQRRLFRASLENDAAGLDEVIDLMRTLKDAWAAIASDLPEVAHA
ncbi:MAG: flagellar export chaperone FliS [Pseudomonadales bacterium]|nr:flagellar export chaperone FliS [Pseudomonadales bacterium]